MSDDAELAAFPAVAAALAPLEPEAQARVLKWAAERYGVALAPSTRPRSGSGDGVRGSDGAGDELDAEMFDDASIYSAVAEETGVPVEELERVFHTDGSVVKLLGPSSKYGSTTTDRARAVAQIVTVVRRVGMGLADTSFEAIKDACETKHCYDHKNFASHHLGKLDGFVVKGEKKNRRLEAKGAGIASFAAVVDSILGPK